MIRKRSITNPGTLVSAFAGFLVMLFALSGASASPVIHTERHRYSVHHRVIHPVHHRFVRHRHRKKLAHKAGWVGAGVAAGHAAGPAGSGAVGVAHYRKDLKAG